MKPHGAAVDDATHTEGEETPPPSLAYVFAVHFLCWRLYSREQEAPYMLEPLVDAWEEEPSCEIKMQLLTAAVKLFFKRPPEMQVWM